MVKQPTPQTQQLKNHFKKGDTKAKTSKPSNDLLIETLQRQVKSLKSHFKKNYLKRKAGMIKP